jgi:dihydroxy-acid dehydratase
VLQAIGGSTNGLIHLTAIANRTSHRIDLEAFDKLGREVPVLIDLKAVGRALTWSISTMPGGVPKLMAQLGDLIDLDTKDHHRRDVARCRRRRRGVPGRTRSARAANRSSRKARWRCCTAISRRAAR